MEKKPKVQKPKKRRPKGTGSIYQRARDGVWIARVDLMTPTGKRSQQIFTGKTRAEAASKLQRARDKGMLRRGDLDTRPLRDFAATWERSVRDGDYKATTRAAYLADLKKRIVPGLGTIRLCDVTTVRVADWLGALKREGVGTAAISRVRRSLSRMLSVAVSQGLIASNPCFHLDPKTIPVYRPPEATTLSHEHVNKLFDELRQSRYGAMVVTALSTGARQGELVGLRWSDVDLRRARMHVRRALVAVDGEFHEGTPKTASSVRVVPLPKMTVKALTDHRKKRQKERLDVERGLVFPTATGEPVARRHLLRKVLYPALKRAKLPRVTWHQLRASCASILIEEGLPVEVVARLLGHANPATTMKIYNKAFRGRERLASDAWDRLFDQR